jgi:hypothetical protein
MFHVTPTFIRGALTLGLLCGLDATLSPSGWAEGDRIELTGSFRYTYHEPMTPAEAKKFACTEAVRLAIESAPFFIDATSSVVDSPLVTDVAQKVISDYAKDVQVLEQGEKGRTVSCKVRLSLNRDEVKKFIAAELNRGPVAEPVGIDQNRALKLLSSRDAKDGTVEVVFKALKRLDWLNTAYDGSLRESADIMIDFYDEQGQPIRSERYPARKTAYGEVMNPGEIGRHKFTKPPGTKSYRAWLVK